MSAKSFDSDYQRYVNPPSLEKLRRALQMPDIRSDKFVEALPFSGDDVTSGSETELQAAVLGQRSCVDLPIAIETSNYFRNIVRRTLSGDSPEWVVTDLEKHLSQSRTNVWDNSWVRFPISRLTSNADAVLRQDLLLNRQDPSGSLRNDLDRFLFIQEGQQWLRIPISYLIKLAIVDALGSQNDLPELVRKTGLFIMDKLLSDNTSPETLSFYVVPLRKNSGWGKAIARETSKRFLLTHLLTMYANSAFGLRELGQTAVIYFSPHPPVRQKLLNQCISDSFYRELFMNPCLSGWDNGKEKHDYMCLCHEILSRSQLHAVGKLREAGIITRNLVVLPNVSNISLANNGTHLTIGSRKLSQRLQQGDHLFTEIEEKYVGDLVIKIVEHFLPLFVGTYSAAPYRLDFADFHPETVLGFLPHEIDYTHLRMMWRRWKKKASIKILGQPTTPFGLRSFDLALATLFRLKGDLIPDFRLIDYMVAPMSTPKSPALDGRLGNVGRLKKDLTDLGTFDSRMSLYMLYRLREYHTMGFSGFEGRHYSLFESLDRDMTEAANLQILVTALAYKLVLQGAIRHSDIPDDPMVESERRQVFFCSAIGIPTFYVHGSTSNKFLKGILYKANGIRYSRRYAGYLRVYCRQYLLALVRTIHAEGADLVENLGLEETLGNLLRRIQEPKDHAVTERLTSGILETMGLSSPLGANADEFNLAAEHYYRNNLNKSYVEGALNHLAEDVKNLVSSSTVLDDGYRKVLEYSLGDRSFDDLVSPLRASILAETISLDDLRKLINIILVTIHYDASLAEPGIRERICVDSSEAPIYPAANRAYL
jgi:hypothetical protein